MSAAPALVALHGFTLAGAMFDELAGCLGQAIAAPDLPGHGAAAEVPATPEAALRVAADAAAAAGAPAAVLGYSLGGRVALHLALARPELVARLVLVSTSPGIADPAERAARRAADAVLADRIEGAGVAAFVDGWRAAPMFAGLRRRGEEWLAADRALRLANTAAGLAAALRGLGRGSYPDLRARLGEVAVPVLVVAGGEDGRYATEAAAMAAAMPGGRCVVIPGAGHSVVGEAPGELAAVVGEFLAG